MVIGTRRGAEELRRLVASLLVVRASGHRGDAQRRYPRWELPNSDLRSLLSEGVGGVILLGGSAAEVRLRTEQLRGWAQEPLLLCADVEEGVGQRFEGGHWLAPPMALGRLHHREPERALALAARYGRCSGREARLLGLNWVLGPVCDVNNNAANPVINVRAWGEDPASAGALAVAFLEAAQAEGVLCCAKHFPGHGDTESDSHLELPRLTHGRQRLEEVEFPPFKAAIAAGVAAVMTGHLELPALDSERPATLSPAVLDGLLRHDLGFRGLIVTDALVMEAIAAHHGPGEAALLAFEAGADLLLMPADARAAIEAVATAVESGRIPWQRLEASLERRRRALSGLERPGSVEPAGEGRLQRDLDALLGGDRRDVKVDHGLERELIEVSLGAPGRPDDPLTSGPRALALPTGPGLNLIRLDNALAAPFLPLMAPALQRPSAVGYVPCLIDGRGPSPWRAEPKAPLDLDRLPPGPVLLQLFVRGNPFRGNAGGDEPWGAVVRQLQTSGRLAALVVYGSPYLWEALHPLLSPAVPALHSFAQTPLAQALALERLGLGQGGLEGGFTD